MLHVVDTYREEGGGGSDGGGMLGHGVVGQPGPEQRDEHDRIEDVEEAKGHDELLPRPLHVPLLLLLGVPLRVVAEAVPVLLGAGQAMLLGVPLVVMLEEEEDEEEELELLLLQLVPDRYCCRERRRCD